MEINYKSTTEDTFGLDTHFMNEALAALQSLNWSAMKKSESKEGDIHRLLELENKCTIIRKSIRISRSFYALFWFILTIIQRKYYFKGNPSFIHRWQRKKGRPGSMSLW